MNILRFMIGTITAFIVTIVTFATVSANENYLPVIAVSDVIIQPEPTPEPTVQPIAPPVIEDKLTVINVRSVKDKKRYLTGEVYNETNTTQLLNHLSLYFYDKITDKFVYSEYIIFLPGALKPQETQCFALEFVDTGRYNYKVAVESTNIEGYEDIFEKETSVTNIHYAYPFLKLDMTNITDNSGYFGARISLHDENGYCDCAVYSLEDIPVGATKELQTTIYSHGYFPITTYTIYHD